MDPIGRIGYSGLSAAERTLDAAAENIANLSNPEYRPAEVVTHSEPGGGVRAEIVERSGPPSPVADLVSEAVALVSYAANGAVVESSHEMAGAVLDTVA